MLIFWSAFFSVGLWNAAGDGNNLQLQHHRHLFGGFPEFRKTSKVSQKDRKQTWLRG